MINKIASLLMALCLFGIIDQIHGNDVRVRFNVSDEEVKYIHIPRQMIPCKIKVGDGVQFNKTSDDTLVVNCVPRSTR